MKISQVTLYHVRMALQSPFETSFGRSIGRDCILAEVRSGDYVGFGECVADQIPGYSYETVHTAWHILRDYLIPEILHKSIEDPSDLSSLSAKISGHPMAKAGLEMAIWDLFGKEKGLSLHQLIGGVRKKVQVGVSVGIQESSNDLVKVVRRYIDKGYKRIKLKIKPEKDMQYTQAVRNAFPEVSLQVDANSAYSLDSVKSLYPMDSLDLLLIEQPLAEDDLWDHRQLQRQMKTPICLDESIRSRRHARQAIDMNACKIINIKPGRVGGLTEAIKIHDYCLSKNIPVWCGGMLETGVGRSSNLALASLPGFTMPGDISASDRYYEKDITKERFNLNSDSTINVPEGVGLGVEIDQKALKRATLSSITLS